MADRKQFLSRSVDDPQLLALLKEARKQVVTEAMLHEQRVSFAFGNAMNSDKITKESVREASQSIRIRA
ncbi:MAG: hypothetical protein KC461_00525 [Dehalococcoidia bacterium]|nr:hypothetical protein [Dehalococcoidia bacterium]